MKDIELKTKPFEQFNDDWALVTAGPIDNHNSMTVSWGGLGTLWSKSVVTIYIKPVRYTHQFIENNDYFVVSFFNEEYRRALQVMGTYSGRSEDKDKLSKLTPVSHGEVTIYKEARLTIICKKIYQNDLDIKQIPEDVVKKYYQHEAPHTMYIGEVVEIINIENKKEAYKDE